MNPRVNSSSSPPGLSRRTVLGVSVAGAAGLLTAAESIRLPDSAAGVINGRVAVMFWPATDTTGGKVAAPIAAQVIKAVLHR